ncbi:MAG: 3-deoxy-D-manno-octulosonic acid kinase [Pseudomonadota bacterium]
MQTKTYLRAGLKVIEYSAADDAKASGAARQYILASSDSAVEDEALRCLFEQHSKHLLSDVADPEVESGRGKVHFFEHHGRKLVLRQYRRGGLVGALVKRSYLWLGLENSRPFTELKLLVELQRLPVNACKPYAARIVRNGLVYQAQLITEQVTDSQTLGELLQNAQASNQVLQLAGEVIRAMHDANIHHADLNASNILIGNGEAVLIDFDRGSVRSSARLDWRGANIERLRRSINKLQQRYGFEFSDDQWRCLLQAYLGNDAG